MGKSAKEAAKDIALLQSKGYAIPLPATQYVKKQELRDKGVRQVWKCNTCQTRYESYIPLTFMGCKNGHKMKLMWDL